jgi:hypothetical protein
MRVKETVRNKDWLDRPQRARLISPEIREIARVVKKISAGSWVVVSPSETEKKRQPTIRGRISATALQERIKVKFEMRAGDPGAQKIG